MGKKWKPIILAVIMVALVGSYYFYLSNKTKTEEETVVTAVQDVLLRNLDKDYPPTPKEVVKYYSEIMKCLYNETYTDEQLEAMLDKMIALYDDELLEKNPRENLLSGLKEAIADYAENKYTITSYTPSNSTDVETSMIEGRECAKLYCTYTIKSGTNYSSSKLIYELRKDADGHWKILGFKNDTDEAQ